MADTVDRQFMQRALELAEKGRGKTAPNPMVGAVIVRNNQIIAEGFHRRAGEDHAEIVALKKLGGSAIGATIYVTLEPCCHTGATGPCCDALIEAGVKRVLFPLRDPNPQVNGKGASKLKKAGIKVETGLLRTKAERLNDSYLGFHRNGRPWVILKSAQTLDGRIATVNGDSQWITGKQARKFTHQMRSEVDAVMVGMGTVRADNPSLTVRMVKGKNPYRVIVTGSGKFPSQCHLLDDNNDFKTIVATTRTVVDRIANRKAKSNLIFWKVKTTRKGKLDIEDLIAQANNFGIRSLLIEGGSELATSFWKARLVDKYVTFVAPLVLGQGIDSIGELDIRRLSSGIRLERTSVELCGQDLVIVGYPKFEK